MKTAYDIILEPVISEQSMDVAQKKVHIQSCTRCEQDSGKTRRRRNLRRRSSQSQHHELRRQS